MNVFQYAEGCQMLFQAMHPDVEPHKGHKLLLYACKKFYMAWRNNANAMTVVRWYQTLMLLKSRSFDLYVLTLSLALVTH